MNIYPASIRYRLAALLIDMLFMSIAGLVMFSAVLSIEQRELAIVTYAISLFLVLFYIPIAETLCHGRTLGKALLKIRVVKADGNRASGVSCLQRYLMWTIDGPLTMGMGALIGSLVTRNRQRLGDLAADTVVVNDKAHTSKWVELQFITDKSEWTADDRAELKSMQYISNFKEYRKTDLIKYYRTLQCEIARMRTYKVNPLLIEYYERLLSRLHTYLYSHIPYSLRDLWRFVCRDIPDAMYQSRHCLWASLAISVIAAAIGIFAQMVNPDFFADFMGSAYYNTTIENIENGNPMGIYGSEDSLTMFVEIFINNALVSLRLYAIGLLTFFGSAFMIIYNFVMVGTFITFFAQHGYLSDALMGIHQHGVLELASIVVAGGAGLRLGSAWLFPGLLTRKQAFVRGARQSIMIGISTIPMLLIAAFIEGFITRHTEWPASVRLSIIIVSALIIIYYYVVLPTFAQNK